MRVSSSSLAQAILCEDLWCLDEAPRIVVEEDDMDCPDLLEDVLLLENCGVRVKVEPEVNNSVQQGAFANLLAT